MITRKSDVLWIVMLLTFVACLGTGVCAQNKGGGGGQGGKGKSGTGELSAYELAKVSKLKIGEDAPDFTLKGLNDETVTLSSFEGKKPVFLIFGSYT